ncbi:MAG: TIGR03618 family F420-dependent PPOX class oxidoreductase [Chloroflexota bacterium]|jgi:PPOX class probable F420-dependent enzyme|nr:TIGR03618 family F420-dependent PPOX class oxidoreductase [Chloroflexota bacterium]MEC9438890.1 TIGR03618 family F420-dependent PPOX class oxidoreductase [Chloroflexota bacterium]|tara:strand:- start:3923 stop:4348 length:426 start_codon:yes stop_codon:yes gene_type:complete
MNLQDAIPFLENNHNGVVGTKRRDGGIHSSIVVSGVFQNNAAFVSVYPKSQKIRNLKRDPHCTILTVTPNWREYVVVEGTAELMDYGNTDAKILRPLLREVYMVCSDTEHPDWDEYDEAMVNQKAVIVLVNPAKIYGLLRD